MKTLSIIFVNLLVGSPVFASLSDALTTSEPDHATAGVQYAQAGTAVSDISPSAQRRLLFYSDQAIEAMMVLANEDLLSRQGSDVSDTGSIDAFRDAIEKLIGAGQRSDLSTEQVALFFEDQVRLSFSGTLPAVVQGTDGQLEVSSLITGVADAMQQSGPNVDQNYLAAVAAEGAEMAESSVQSVEVAQSETPVITEVDEASVFSDESASPEVRAILSRVQEEGDSRIIEIAPGDTLASLAFAFYGDTLQYRRLYNANVDILDNPNSLQVGLVLRIPE